MVCKVSVDAVVVGAGFAGLSAGVALSDRGIKVLVLEARPQLGGRATSYIDSQTGDHVDNGQHVLFGCYHETFKLFRRLGVASDVQLQVPLAVETIDIDGSVTRLECPYLPAPLHLIAGILEWDGLSRGDRFGILSLLRPIWCVRRGKGDRGYLSGVESTETVTEWLSRHRQCGQIRKLLWEPLVLAAMNQHPDKVSAVSFLQVLAALCGPDIKDAAIGIPRRPLEQLYAIPAKHFIEARGGQVLTQSIARVRCRNDRLAGVEVGTKLFKPKAVVSAVPWYALSRLFPDQPPALKDVIADAEETESCPIVTVNLWLDRPLAMRPFLGLAGRTMQWVFDKRFIFGASTSHLSLVSSGAREIVNLSNDQIIRLAVDELRQASLLNGCHVRHGSVIRERQATFSLAPGQPVRPETKTTIDGLFLAGDWIDTGLPSTIEGAVRSGHRAAAAMFEWLSDKSHN